MRVFPKLGLQITAFCLSILLFSVQARGWGGDSVQTVPGTQSAYGANAGAALVDAQRDAEATGTGIWYLAGCCLPLLGIVLAFAMEPDPPASRLLGKSMDYVLIYSGEYRRHVKNERVKHALIGCGMFALAYIGIYVAAIVISLNNSQQP